MLKAKLSKLEKEIYNSDLHYFIKRCFNIINPNTKYVDNWHIEAISRVLEKVEDGTINFGKDFIKALFDAVTQAINQMWDEADRYENVNYSNILSRV